MKPSVSVNAQIHVLAASIIVRRREVRRQLGSQVQLSSPNEVNNGNHIGRSLSFVFARWWRLGILPLARVESGLNTSRGTRVNIVRPCGKDE